MIIAGRIPGADAGEAYVVCLSRHCDVRLRYYSPSQLGKLQTWDHA